MDVTSYRHSGDCRFLSSAQESATPIVEYDRWIISLFGQQAGVHIMAADETSNAQFELAICICWPSTYVFSSKFAKTRMVTFLIAKVTRSSNGNLKKTKSYVNSGIKFGGLKVNHLQTELSKPRKICDEALRDAVGRRS